MNAITGIGKYLFLVPFAAFGIMHFMNGQAMAGMVPIPGGAIWIYLTGLAMVLAVVSVLLGKKDGLATLLLGIMLIVFVLSIWLPSVLNAADEGSKTMAMGNLLKDIGLAGGAFVYSRFAAKEPTK